MLIKKITVEFETNEEALAFLSGVPATAKTTTTTTTKKGGKAAAKAEEPVQEPVLEQPQAQGSTDPFGGSNFGPSTQQQTAAAPVQEPMERHAINTQAIAGEVQTLVNGLTSKGYEMGEVGGFFGQIFAKMGIQPAKVSALPPEQMLAFYNIAKEELPKVPAKQANLV